MTRCAGFYAKFTWMIILLVKSTSTNASHKHNTTTIYPTADNKDEFRRCKGVKILIKILKEHKGLKVVNALRYVLSGNGKHNLKFIIAFFCAQMLALINTIMKLEKLLEIL